MANSPHWITYNNSALDRFSYRVLLFDPKYNNVGIESFISTLSIKQELIRNSMILEMKISDARGILDLAYIQVGSLIRVDICRDPYSELESQKNVVSKSFIITKIDNNIQSAQLKQRVFNVTAYSLSGVSNAWPLLYSDYSGPTKPTDIIKQIVQKRFINKYAAETKNLVSKIVEDNGKWIDCTNEIKNGILL
jgi:hypothetical protein